MFDFAWATVAYIRGVLFREWFYRPLKDKVHADCAMFHGLPRATDSRMKLLSRWWGYRPCTAEERAVGRRDYIVTA